MIEKIDIRCLANHKMILDEEENDKKNTYKNDKAARQCFFEKGSLQIVEQYKEKYQNYFNIISSNDYEHYCIACEGQKIKITNTCNKKILLLATSVWGCYPESIIVKTIFNSYKVNIYFKDWYYGETNWKMDKFDCNVFIVGKDMETKSNRYIYIHEIELEGENSPIELKLPYNPDIFIFALSCE